MFFFCFCLGLNLDKSHCNLRQCTYWHPWHLLTTPFTVSLFPLTLFIFTPYLYHSVAEQFHSKYVITRSLWEHLDKVKRSLVDFVLVVLHFLRRVAPMHTRHFRIFSPRHWLQFWQLRTRSHDNLCEVTIKSDSVRNSWDVSKNWKTMGNVCEYCVGCSK